MFYNKKMEQTLRVEKIVADGKSIGHLNGKTVFVQNALPDELVSLENIIHKKDYIIADIKDIVESSPDRITPACPLYKICGGCNFQHTSIENQLKFKNQFLQELILHESLLDKSTIINSSFFEVFKSQPFEYRNRIRFHLLNPGAIPSFEGRKSRNLVPIQDCMCAVAPIRQELNSGILQKRIKNSLTLLKNNKYKEDELHLFSLEKDFLSKKDLDKDSFITLETEKNKIVNVELFPNKIISFDVRGFFQSNLKALKNLISQIIPKEDDNISNTRVLDMYSGCGTFSTFLQDYFSQVVLMEHNEKSLLQARNNVQNSKAIFVCTSDDNWEKTEQADWTYDLIIADPPRQGLSLKARNWIKKSKCDRFIYVSCNPVTFFRDAKDLVLSGFKLEKGQLHDFYPQTDHMETLTFFTRQKK